MSDINQPSLPTPFYSVPVSISVFVALSIVFHSINSLYNTPFSDCSFGLISALLVPSTIYFSMRVSFSPDIIPGGWLGSQPQLTNNLCMCMTLVLCSIIRVPAGSPSRGGGFCDLRPWHKPAEFAHSFLFCSCVYFCISCPFNCIPFHKILPTILCFLTLFFPFYFCFIGPCNYVSLYESLPNPDIIRSGWLGTKHQLTNHHPCKL